MKKYIIGITLVLGILGVENVLNVEAMEYSDVPAGFYDSDWNYEYEVIDYGYEMLIGATYQGLHYSYLYDESGIIVGMLDANGEQIVKYEYDIYGLPINTFSFENGMWVENDNYDFIGNQNKMLSAGYFYDDLSECYYIYGRYYAPVQDKYMDGIDDSSSLTDVNPFLEEWDEGIQPYSDTELINKMASDWAESLLSSSSYGKAITNHSSNWYASLSDVEILARAIYCEGGTVYTNEEDAVAWVILNRVNNSGYSNEPRGVVTQAGQFASITGEKETSTVNARIPATGTKRWEHSTYLACLLLTSTDTTKWKNIVGNTINGQLYFYSYTVAKNSTVFTGSGNALKYNGKDIKNVQVLGYGSVSSFDTLFENYSPTNYSRNIYYDFK